MDADHFQSGLVVFRTFILFMRFVAFILALSICAFIGETFVLAERCIEPDSKSTCTMAGKAEMTHCEKKLPHDTGHSQKHPNCMDCPLFSMATYQPLIQLLKPVPKPKQFFVPLEISGLADYHALSWKPPDFRDPS